MTSKQLFDLIDKTGDKFLKEAMEDEAQYPEMFISDTACVTDTKTEKKFRFPIRPIAVCAACLAVIVGISFIGRNIGQKIDPFFGKPAKGVISKIAEKDMVDYTANSAVSFKKFSYTLDRFQHITNSERLNVSAETTVNAEVEIGIGIAEHGFPTDNVPARVFFLKDGKPADFKLADENDEPSAYKDLMLTDPEYLVSSSKYYLGKTFNIEFEASPEDEQFTAVVVFFPDDAYDMQASTLSQGQAFLADAVTVRNSAAKVTGYDYSKVGELTPEDLEWHQTGAMFLSPTDHRASISCGNAFKQYTLNRNIDCKVLAYNKGIAYRQFIIMDGQLMEFFGGHYSMLCGYGVRDSEFTLYNTQLPESGVHNFLAFQEPIMPEILDGKMHCEPCPAVTVTFAENMNELQNEANKFIDHYLSLYDYGKFSPFNVRVYADDYDFNSGEKIKIKATIQNRDLQGAKRITLYSANSSAGVSMYIYQNFGDDLLNTDGYYLRGVSEKEPTVIELEPGEEYNIEFNFDKVIEKNGVKITAPEGMYKGEFIFQFYESGKNGTTYLSNEVLTFGFRLGEL